ncbi:MAG: glycosyltransferase family 4 protein, partial [Methanobacteriota archaeon]
VAYQGHIVMRGFRPIVDSTMAEYIFRKADVVISQNETTRRYASRFRPRRMITIPQGVDLDRFEPREEGEAVAFVAARLVPQKGGEIFVKAVPKVIEEIGKARFMVIGEGVQKRYLENLAYDLGVAEYIEFVGRIPHMKVPEYLEQAKIVVFPSEIPTGLALLEAAAMKRAIIAVRNTWTVDSLGDAPVYVSALDPEETAHAIAYLLKNDDKRKAVADLVHERVGPEQDWDIVASKHLEIYSQLVDEKLTS